MSSFRPFFTLIFILALLLGIQTAIAATIGQELLPNTTLAPGSDWFLRDASIVPADGGLKQVVLSGVKRGPYSWSHAGTEITPIPIDRQLTFSCRLRGTHSGQQMMVNAFAYDSSNRLLKNWSKVLTVGKEEWTSFSSDYVAPSNASSLTLWV